MELVTIIDNYDSFTYNLVHMVNEIIKDETCVMRNDQVDYQKLEASSHIILSPGPGIPDEAGELKNIIRQFAMTKNILGVCLGHQAIGEVFGSKIYNLANVFHGRKTKISLTQNASPLFIDLPNSFNAGRYHSWAIDRISNLNNFLITAEDEEGEIMAISHRSHSVFGVQFHPESIMTEYGKDILRNFIKLPELRERI